MIAVLLAPGFEEVEALTVADFLNRAGIEVKLVGVGTQSRETLNESIHRGPLVTGAHRITVQADFPIEDMDKTIPEATWKGVVIPGGMPGSTNLAESEQVLTFIKKLFANNKLVAAICAAPALVLMKAGILTGKSVTCYPGMENRFRDCNFSEKRVVVDGQLITSRGPGTAAEFSLKLIEKLAGKNKADEIYKATLQQYS